MPLYAGVFETNITPPPGMAMSGYGARTGPAIGVHDELYARILVADNGQSRIALAVADVIAFSDEMAQDIRAQIGGALGIGSDAVLLHATHTHGGPHLGLFRDMGERDAAYESILVRKIVGAAQQASDALRPAHFILGESAAQIGINRRASGTNGKPILGQNTAGPVLPTVQTLCANSPEGHTFAMLFCHACHATTLGSENRYFTADWPGAAVSHLRARALQNGGESGIEPGAVLFALQGCAGDVNPLRRGDWQAMEANGRAVAEAAHTARWNAHGRSDDTLNATRVTLDLPLAPAPFLSDAPETRIFSIQKLTLGGIVILGFPAELFVGYALDFAAATRTPLLSLAYTNGCQGYFPTTSEFVRGGYEVEEAPSWYQMPVFAPECETLLKEAVYRLLDED